MKPTSTDVLQNYPPSTNATPSEVLEIMFAVYVQDVTSLRSEFLTSFHTYARDLVPFPCNSCSHGGRITQEPLQLACSGMVWLCHVSTSPMMPSVITPVPWMPMVIQKCNLDIDKSLGWIIKLNDLQSMGFENDTEQWYCRTLFTMSLHVLMMRKKRDVGDNKRLFEPEKQHVQLSLLYCTIHLKHTETDKRDAHTDREVHTFAHLIQREACCEIHTWYL